MRKSLWLGLLTLASFAACGTDEVISSETSDAGASGEAPGSDGGAAGASPALATGGEAPATHGGSAGEPSAGEAGEPSCSGPDCGTADATCSGTEDTTCFAKQQVCVKGGAACVEPDSLASCAEAAQLPARQAMGPILGARSFVTRDPQSDTQCELGVGANLLPAGATKAYVLRLQFSDAEADGLVAPLSDKLQQKIQIAANAPDILAHVYASGLEGGGANGYFNIVVCLEKDYAIGGLTVAIEIPDQADHMSNAVCVTYEGGMNGSRP